MGEIKIKEIIDSIHAVVGPTHGESKISLHEPSFTGNEWNYVKECIDTGWVSSVGKFVDRFENNLQEFTGVERAIAVCNGTAALHTCLLLVGIKSNDEVLLPSLTFIATANAIMYCQAIPHFVDCNNISLGVDAEKLRSHLKEIAVMSGKSCINKITNRPIRALIVMHAYGHPSDLDPLIAICEEYNIDLIEDAAESLGSYYKGKHTGSIGRVSSLSFNGNKIATTGGGGAVITNDIKLGELAKHLTTTAKIPHQWSFRHDLIGYNYRLPNINAALGCAQLEQVPRFIEKKRSLQLAYTKAFQKIPGMKIFSETSYAKSNYWLNVLLLSEANKKLRDQILTACHEKNILARPTWDLLHTLPMYNKFPKADLTNSLQLSERIINLPSSPSLLK